MRSPGGHGLHERFLRGLALSPHGVAVRAGAESLTYTQAHELALCWGGALAGAEHRTVGVLAGKGRTAYAGILAALYAGAAVVPLRPDFPVARTRQMLDASRATALVCDAEGLAVAGELLGDRDDVAVLAPEADPGDARFPVLVAEPHHTLHRPRPVGRADPAYLLFTSGSTGRPKGVVITHGSTEHYFRLLDARYDFTPADVFSQTFDLNFDCSLFDLFCAWGAGGTAVVVPPQAYRALPEYLADAGLTVWFSTPGVIGLARRMGGLGAAALPGLRWSFFAGEALTCRDALDWRRAAPQATLENLYGPTELTVTVAAYRWCDVATPRAAVNGVVPIGALHDGHDRLLLDEQGNPTDGEGELCVAGPQLTPGYLDPADERGRFLTRNSVRWYRTGDRVRVLGPDELAYLGRLDSQVQVQGWRVELAEIENAMRARGVPDAVAVGVPGPDGTQLFAFYTGARLATVDIVRRLRTVLPEGVIPRHYRNLTELPMNSNRKIDRSRLTTLAAELLTSG